MHSYIFCGENSKYADFAKSILCDKGVDNKPCHICKSCVTFEANNHPDVIYVQSEKLTIGVDIVREQINKHINIKPYGNHKIVIIKDAHTLTEAAQNALLKTLEEPPKYAIMILLAHTTSNFLPTLISRCAIIRAQQNNNIGNYISAQDFTINFLLDLGTQSLDGVFNLFKILEKNKENIEPILDTMQMFFRDCLVLKQTRKEDFVTQKDKLNTMVHYIESATEDNLIKRLEAVNFGMYALNKNANFQMAMELMLLNIRQN